MKKKVLYGVALALFASVSAGSLQSCKDDVNDLKTQTSYDLTSLRSKLESEAARLDGRIDAEAAARMADINTVKGLIAALEAAQDGDMAAVDQALNGINASISGLQGDVVSLNGALNAATTRIDALEGLVPNLYTKDEVYSKGEVDGMITTLNNELDALKTAVQEGDEGLEALIRETQETLTQLINLHTADIEDLQAQIDEITNAIDAIVAQMDSQITGILIQGVNSPVFGDFRVPLGIKSNILFNWYGYNERNAAVEFPSNNEGFSATGKPGLDLAKLAPANMYSAPVGYYGDDDTNVTLGKVYVTLNPVNANVSHLDLSIENSAGVALPMTVTLTPSEEILYHGYSRAVETNSNNGFYEGEVKMALNDENVDNIRVKIEDELKSSMKNALKDPSKTTAKALVKAVFDQLQGKIPAYALRYGWNVGLEDELSSDPGFSAKYYAVLSQYDLAVATAHPLSYNFLAGYNGSGKIPTFGHIDNLIHKLQQDGDIKLDLKPIVIKGANITIKPITISSNVNVSGGKIVITIDPIQVNMANGMTGTTVKKEVTVEGDQLSSVYDAIKTGIEGALSDVSTSVNGWTADMQKDLNKQLNDILTDVQTQVNNMINSINGQIDDMLTNLGNKFQPYFDKVNKAIDIYNKVANKFNKFLEDPNAYLQVAAFYNMGGTGYGVASGKLSDPTPFVNKGGNAFKIYLSSYTGELIVPACKKYVAITGVYKNGAAVANADLAALNTGDLNTVLSGDQIEVEVSAAGLEKGNVYEFTYQALDYSGYTSTKKFYIEVK